MALMRSMLVSIFPPGPRNQAGVFKLSRDRAPYTSLPSLWPLITSRPVSPLWNVIDQLSGFIQPQCYLDL